MPNLMLVGIAGFAASMVDGALGMGFGPTSSSILLSSGVSPAATSASVNIAKVATGLAAGISHWRFRNIDRRLVLRLAIPGAIGAGIGATVLANVDGKTIRPYLALLLIAVGLRILIRFSRRLPAAAAADENGRSSFDVRGVEVAANAGGITNGLIGAWGPVVTPYLMHHGVPPRFSIGCANTAEIAVAVVASGTLLGTEGIDVGVVIAMLLGGVAASPLAAFVVRFIPSRLLGLAVAGLLLLTQSRELANTDKLPFDRWFAYVGIVLAVAVGVICPVSAIAWLLAPCRGSLSPGRLARMSAVPPVIDILDRAFWQRNPHDAWAWCREHDPLHRDARSGIVCVTKHADVMWVERHDELFSSDSTYRMIESPGESNMIANDDPVHLYQRRLVNRRFTPRAAKSEAAYLAATIDKLVDPLTPIGRTEVVADIAGQLPARFTARLLGLDEDEWWSTLKQWSERLMRIDAAMMDAAVLADLMATLQELMALVGSKQQELTGCPADGLLSAWANATMPDGEPMPVQTIFHETGLFVSGGAETTRTAIAHGLRTFCDHADQWELLADKPELMPSAVDEVIRWVTPLNNMFRRATADTEIRGVPIHAGDRLALVYPSANRDEEVFEDPFTFDVTRSPNPHLAFGYGTHFCIGANVARLELELLFAKLTAAWTNLRPLTEPDVEPNHFARAVRSFDSPSTPAELRSPGQEGRWWPSVSAADSARSAIDPALAGIDSGTRLHHTSHKENGRWAQ